MKRYNIVEDEDQSEQRNPNNQQQKEIQKPLDKFDRMEQIGNWIWIKLQAVAWISGALAIIYYSNFFRNLFHNPNINQLFLTIFMLGIGICISISIYAAIILPHILNVQQDLETYNPRAIQIGAFSGFVSFMTLLISIWPVWGWLSFPMIFTMFLGFLNTGHFLPNHQISGVIFGGVFIGAFFSHQFIEHEGYWH